MRPDEPPEMIERVVEAMYDEHRRIDRHTVHSAGMYVRLAHAAIQAMREPTKEMTETPLFSWSTGYGDEPWVSPEDAADNWRLMIDEALK